ncbi:MAG: PEGA domain-containing protein [Sandaracinaceae bacterium]|nr:PEGA domain-containing protein [Sandaracinaceae bacterium]
MTFASPPPPSPVQARVRLRAACGCSSAATRGSRRGTRSGAPAVALAVTRLVVLALALTCGAGTGQPAEAHAQTTDNAEARAFFVQGNRAFERSQRAQGARRRELLEEALGAYVASLAIVRSKNALFNAGVTLAALGRPAEAYAYFGEYLTQPGLTDDERAAGAAQRGTLLERLALVTVQSTPPGAEVRVDRPDLGAAGRTPLTLPLAPGEHVLLLRAEGYEDGIVGVAVSPGDERTVEAQLVPRPGQAADGEGARVEGTPGGPPDATGAPRETGAPDAGPPRADPADADSEHGHAEHVDPQHGDTEHADPAHSGADAAVGASRQRSTTDTTGEEPHTGPSRGLRIAAWSGASLVGLGALALRLRAGRLVRAHEVLGDENDPRPFEQRLERAMVLDRRIARSNRASQTLTVLGVLGGGLALGLSLRARRVRRAQLQLDVRGELGGLSLGVSGVLW